MAAPSTPDRNPRPAWSRPPALGRWDRCWRYLAAMSIGAAAWIAQAAVWLSVPLTPAQEDLVGAALFADLLLGVLMLAILPLRRRSPALVAGVTAAASAVSVAALGSTALAIGSMSTWRRRSWVMWVCGTFLAAWAGSEALYRSRLDGAQENGFQTVFDAVLGALFLAVVVAVGYYVGARRELVEALHERVAAVEREQALTAKAARDGERNRIAREMHDVLAHRISLVALHAGALTYREDLDRAQTSATAETIQLNAQLALTELRQVLGVLRPGHEGAVHEPPQPTLAELPALLADAREAGSLVELERSDQLDRSLEDLPELLSRNAFRIIQEALTNARRHASGQPVRVRLVGTPGTHLELLVRNPVGARVDGPAGAGMGLLGLSERVELAGGTLEHGAQPDGSFVVQARLPWPA